MVAVEHRHPGGHHESRARAYLKQQAGKVSGRRERFSLKFEGGLGVLGYKNERQVKGRKRRPEMSNMCLGVACVVGKVSLPLVTLRGMTPATQEKMEVWSCLAHACRVCALHQGFVLCLLGTFCSK